jgi:protein-S-isoprenylcysteine O-methyltransferase Ste14
MTGTASVDPVARRHWSDFVGVVCYTILGVNIALGSRELGLLILPSLVHELLVAAAFLLRGPARRITVGTVPRAVGYLHTFLIIGFLQFAAVSHPEWITASSNETARLAGSYLWLISSILGIWPLWYLRRSFSLEPEARQLVTTGPYRLARHPIYTVYILNNTGIWLRTLSMPFLIVLLLWFALLLIRVRYEESVLSAAFPEYESYRRRVGAFGPKPVKQAA